MALIKQWTNGISGTFYTPSEGLPAAESLIDIVAPYNETYQYLIRCQAWPRLTVTYTQPTPKVDPANLFDVNVMFLAWYEEEVSPILPSFSVPDERIFMREVLMPRIELVQAPTASYSAIFTPNPARVQSFGKRSPVLHTGHAFIGFMLFVSDEEAFLTSPSVPSRKTIDVMSATLWGQGE